MNVVFRFSSASARIEVEGPESFVRSHLEFLLPHVRSVTGAAPSASTPGAPAPAAGGPDGLPAWWEANVPASADPSLQDTILVFAYHMRTYRKLVFMSEDIRRAFGAMGMEEPRSLLQILGTLKRDHGLLLNAGKRGEYMMNTTGIARVRTLIGVKPGTGPQQRGTVPVLAAGKSPDARSIFRD